jgi:MoaA/NifB/PqqE/SkfB family radical SAM enzyme
VNKERNLKITKAVAAAMVLKAWWRILKGYNPVLSIELTRECPLHCPGCYAYNPEHIGGGVTLRELRDKKGPDLVEGVLALVKKYKPIHVSIIGGEPLVRARELGEILPKLSMLKIHTQLVTSAVRQIPMEWSEISNLQICVSIDGLQPEHDERRKPATYERILKNIQGQRITVHCTVTRQQLRREGYLEEFIRFWSAQEPVERIWMSLYTPQKNELSEERLEPEDRELAVDTLLNLRPAFPKLDMPPNVIRAYRNPPKDPDGCVFAKTTTCVSADFEKIITPCQFGGNPDCENCGCMASAGLSVVGNHPLTLGVTAGDVYNVSRQIGHLIKTIREPRNSISQNK